MTELTAVRATIPEFSGLQLAPGGDGYDRSRSVFNAMVDRSPRLIATCRSAADVAAAIVWARTSELPISVYGGGHSVNGSAVVDGGVCVDLRGLREVVVDPERSTAQVGGGCTWGEVDAATQAHGLAVTGGRVSTTGVGGLALGSGSGWIERRFGFTCDNLLEAQVVTADGRIVTASETENPDLFWALRGGGGNFGVVTRFTLRLHPVGPLVFGGMLMYPGPMGAAVLRNFRDFIADAPDEVGGGVAFITAPPIEMVPEPARGKPAVGVIVAYTGPLEDAEAALAPLLGFGPPALAHVGPMPYVALQQMLDDANPHGMHNYWTADFLEELPDDAVETLAGLATSPVSPLSQVIIVPGGGAVARVPEDATAFGERQAPFNIHYLSMWPDAADTEANIAHTRALAAAMKPWTSGRVYLNFIGDEGQERVQSAFGEAKLARLQAIKAVWDPQNVFRHNQNIAPAG
jgi:FAD/FMN-containing dehydrogenase